MSVRSQRLAFRPINSGFERNAETVVKVIDRPHPERRPFLPRIWTTELRLFVESNRLHGEAIGGLDREVVRHPESPGVVQIGTGAIERALEVVGGAGAVLNAEIVISSEESSGGRWNGSSPLPVLGIDRLHRGWLIRPVNQPNGPTRGGLGRKRISV